MSDLDKFKAFYKEVGIPFVIRQSGEYSYFFEGEPKQTAGIQIPKDNFETTDLDTLLLRNKYKEFENGQLVSW